MKTFQQWLNESVQDEYSFLRQYLITQDPHILQVYADYLEEQGDDSLRRMLNGEQTIWSNHGVFAHNNKTTRNVKPIVAQYLPNFPKRLRAMWQAIIASDNLIYYISGQSPLLPNNIRVFYAPENNQAVTESPLKSPLKFKNFNMQSNLPLMRAIVVYVSQRA